MDVCSRRFHHIELRAIRVFDKNVEYRSPPVPIILESGYDGRIVISSSNIEMINAGCQALESIKLKASSVKGYNPYTVYSFVVYKSSGSRSVSLYTNSNGEASVVDGDLVNLSGDFPRWISNLQGWVRKTRTESHIVRRP